MWPLLTAIGLALWALACAALDWRERRIPNALTAPAMLAGAAYVVTLQFTLLGQAPWTHGLGGIGLALAFALPGYLLGKLGGGDVKMLLAVALLGGFPAVLAAVLGAGGLAVFLLGTTLAGRSAAVSTLPLPASVQRLGRGVATADLRRIPLGVGFAAGLVVYAFALAWPAA
ncbi:prepilin peptidase [Thioalkalivibrio sp. ALR17-21]|uniref:prepilin peptidase n=1 Tax=Thioalkalivibrio sp. ALR17-21 TaxID=1269813 RepID=UPI000405E65A|nr:prepilin peptidase [Thioalkalivibrio sp. ALR17-21]